MIRGHQRAASLLQEETPDLIQFSGAYVAIKPVYSGRTSPAVLNHHSNSMGIVTYAFDCSEDDSRTSRDFDNRSGKTVEIDALRLNANDNFVRNWHSSFF